ncbi:MAG: hypothetical protein QOH76_2691, partial [Thermoleophilaceae bacterium]|nr:hypothetical protein [Thermoleophilaceae bacterium]
MCGALLVSVVACLATASAAGAPATISVLKRIAHDTQFPSGCVGSVYSPVLQRNALTEPHVAVDPSDARR